MYGVRLEPGLVQVRLELPARHRRVLSRTRRRSLSVHSPVRAALVGALLLASGAARADALRVQYVTRVPEGQTPRVHLEALEALGPVTVSLQRDDGKTYGAVYEHLRAGEARDVPLGGEAGTHKYSGTIVIGRGAARRESTLSLEAVVAPVLKVGVDRARVDLDGRKLEVVLSRAAGAVDISVVDDRRSPPVSAHHDFSGHPAGDPLTVTWPATAGRAARIDLKVTDADGFYQSLSLLPWAVSIPHQEVSFATGSAEIAPAERPKLDGSLDHIASAIAQHRELGPIKLFIAGHTDTVGDARSNLALSLARAQAIANYFRRKALPVPIAYEGFGETSPAVATRDNQDEPRNRRVDYILAIEEPALRSASGFRARWKYLK